VQTSKGEGLDGRSVETWYRAGRHREIADYCLEDVRATAELYERITPTLLMFNKEFREAEERDAKFRRERESQQSLIPMSESSFMEAVAQGSLELTESLEQLDITTKDDEEVVARHQALILEKLAAAEEPEDEIPNGV